MSYPFVAFNFAVEIYPDGSSAPLAEASFAECDGIEVTYDIKTIREGGANDRAIRVPGIANYSNLTLKRGMTSNFDLWKWAQDSMADPALRANAEVVMFADDGVTERARFQLQRCLPVKFKAPTFNAKDGNVAIEEFQLAYEKIRHRNAAIGAGAMTGPALSKAKLVELQEDMETTLDGGKEIPVQFNPDSLKVTYANEVKQPEGGDQAAGTSGRQFVGAGTTKLALTLWFDVTSMTDNPVDDVRRLTKDVIYFMTPKESQEDPTKLAPPGIRFQWGSFIFNGMVEGMEETLEFFSPDGKPLRASMSLTLSQQKILVSKFEQPNSANPRKGQRPFASAKQGDSLQNMAGAAGKGGDWQSIASANGIEDPLRLSAGAMIDLNAGAKISGGFGASASVSAPSIDVGASINVGAQISAPRLGIN